MGSGEYREGKIWVSTRKGGILASTGKVGSGRVPKKPKQAKRSKQSQGKGVGPRMTSRVC